MKHDLAIVYSENYTISLGGIENYHPFDTTKFRKAHDELVANGVIQPQSFIVPEPVTEEELLFVHTRAYLDSLADPRVAARIAEVTEISYLPPSLIKEGLYTPLRWATGGTIRAARLALTHGAACNLGGGFHHAARDAGGGFCYYADIAIAVHVLWQDHPKLRVLIVDLDAHMGNGTAVIFDDDPRITIFDMYNADIFPLDEAAARLIDHPVRLHTGMNTETYLTMLQRELPRVLDDTAPGLLIYNAGTDVWEHDPLGGLAVTAEGILERDLFVFQEARRRGIPFLMLTAGGYSGESGHLIASTLKSLILITH